MASIPAVFAAKPDGIDIFQCDDGTWIWTHGTVAATNRAYPVDADTHYLWT